MRQVMLALKNKPPIETWPYDADGPPLSLERIVEEHFAEPKEEEDGEIDEETGEPKEKVSFIAKK